MSRPYKIASLLLVTSALVAPWAACAQSAPGSAGTDVPPTAATSNPTGENLPPAAADAAAQQQDEAAPDVSIPGGGDIVVVGTRGGNIAKSSAESVSVLSSADIARTGEGDIAGALGRVTGLTVVGNGFVYVRGLGDRYSSALLNGSPLPSPEPLRRTIPLDLFPTSVVASSLVQKSYSVNFPGEFGGGVINLTTKAVPKTPFLSVGASIGADSRTTGQFGYTYFGSASDWTGFDNGQRNLPPALQSFFDSGKQISQLSSSALNPAKGTVAGDNQIIASQLIDARNSVVQRNKALPPNWAANLTGGKSWDVGDGTVGVIATAGYSNKWRTRDVTQQTTLGTQTLSDFERVITDDHIVANGLLGLSAEFGPSKVRATGLYIRDTLKQARIGLGTTSESTGTLFNQQNTAWFERQLIDSQIVGEFKMTPEFELDVRAGYANSKRNAPDEIEFSYVKSPSLGTFAPYFVNLLNGGNLGSASVRYSKLNEDLWSGGVDLSYKFSPDLKATLGYAYSDTNRVTDVRGLEFRAQFPDNQTGVGLLRPDLLLSPAIIKYYGITLVNSEPGVPVVRGTLRNHGVYAQLQAQFLTDFSLNLGVRYETARQMTTPLLQGDTPVPTTLLDRDYWLPAATLTYQLNPEMQVRLSASKTIARPQFRELLYQRYYDPESNTTFFGNPLLTDSQLYNLEGRYEWYFAREQRVSLAGFYKRIDHPIETFISPNSNGATTSFANAPKADLYGGEFEFQKYVDLTGVSGAGFFASRRGVLIANYTYTKSKLIVGADDPAAVFAQSVSLATQLFRDGAAMTGQSKHIANLELGLEDKEKLSQQTFLLSYASRRVTRRGAGGAADIYEAPGFHLDFVARQGVKIRGINTEMKLEVRNITGTKYQEYQDNGGTRVFYNRYNVGTSATFGIGVNF